MLAGRSDRSELAYIATVVARLARAVPGYAAQLAAAARFKQFLCLLLRVDAADAADRAVRARGVRLCEALLCAGTGAGAGDGRCCSAAADAALTRVTVLPLLLECMAVDACLNAITDAISNISDEDESDAAGGILDLSDANYDYDDDAGEDDDEWMAAAEPPSKAIVRPLRVLRLMLAANIAPADAATAVSVTAMATAFVAARGFWALELLLHWLARQAQQPGQVLHELEQLRALLEALPLTADLMAEAAAAAERKR